MTEVTSSPRFQGAFPGSSGGFGAPCGSPLGTNAKLRATTPTGRRIERYALQSAARDILPNSRTALCLRCRIAGQGSVEVWKSDKHATAHYGGLQTCGSVWTCPVCAAKITERRRIEVQQAIGLHRARGGEVQLLTLTTPHTRGDDLSELLYLQANALQAFLRHRAVKVILAEMGELGRIRAFEVTHGRKGTNNGWHPHFHFLMFCTIKADAVQLMTWRIRLHAVWDSCCQRAGLGSPSFEYGLDLQDGSKADRYVSKWGLEDEMTRGHTKKGRAGGETPFDLLRAYLADSDDKQAAALFQEFARCFKGRRQLSWSNGLKARFQLSDKDDEEIASEVEEDAQLLGLITSDQWRDVLKVKARATVLELAAEGGWYAVSRYLWFIEGAHAGVQFDDSMLAEVPALILGICRHSCATGETVANTMFASDCNMQSWA